jgi:hypothetical protein
VREREVELPCGNEHFFNEQNAECGHYRQTPLKE